MLSKPTEPSDAAVYDSARLKTEESRNPHPTLLAERPRFQYSSGTIGVLCPNRPIAFIAQH